MADHSAVVEREVSAYSLVDGSQAWVFDSKKPIRNAITLRRRRILRQQRQQALRSRCRLGAPRWTDPFKASGDVCRGPRYRRARDCCSRISMSMVWIPSRERPSGERDCVCHQVHVPGDRRDWRACRPSMISLGSGPPRERAMGIPEQEHRHDERATDGRHVLFGTKEGTDGVLYCLDGRGRSCGRTRLRRRIGCPTDDQRRCGLAPPRSAGQSTHSVWTRRASRGTDPVHPDGPRKWVDRVAMARRRSTRQHVLLTTWLVYNSRSRSRSRGADISTFRPRRTRTSPGVRRSSSRRHPRRGSGRQRASIQMLAGRETVNNEYNE